MSSEANPRIAPGGRRDVGVLTMFITAVSGRVTGTAPPNLFLTLGRNRRLFRRWLWFSAALMPGGRLARKESELAILRVAHRRGSDYEWEQHRRLGKRAGLTDAAIDAVAGRALPKDGVWTKREGRIIEAIDQLVDHRDVDDDLWSRLTAHFDDNELIELLMLAGQYDGLATTIGALRIRTDRPRRG